MTRATTTATGLRQAVVVLGMHRSGTSALAGALVHLGAAAPATQIAPGKQNPKGFFESRPVARLNDRLLERVGRTWDDWLAMPRDWHTRTEIREMRDDAAGLLESEFGTPDILVLKDPRLCRLYPFWSGVLQDNGVAPLPLLTFRCPNEVAASLEVRNRFGRAQGLLLWAAYVLQAEADTRGATRAFTTFDRVLDAPIDELSRIGEALGLDFATEPQAAAGQIADFLEPGLRSHVDSGDDCLPPPVATLHEIFGRWADSGEDAADYPLLDRTTQKLNLLTRISETDVPLGAAPDGADPAADWLGALGYLGNDAILAEARRPAAQASETETPRRALLIAGAALQSELSLIQEKCRLQAEEIAGLKTATDVRDRELGMLARLLSEAQDQASARDAELSAARDAQRKAADALEAVNRDLRSAREEASRAQARLAEQAQHLADREAEAARLARENGELHALVARVEDQRRALAESTIWRATAPVRWTLNLFRRQG